MADLVPIIYSLRSTVNESKPLSEQTEVIADALLKLERLYDGFDELHVVAAAKQTLAEQVVNKESGLSVKNHVHEKGFEPIKRALIHGHIPDTLAPDQLLDYKFKAPAASKKQKSGGFSYAFDFDSLPMFEGLEIHLECLRVNSADQIALTKIMNMDLSELVEHPQWEETLQLLLKTLSTQHDPELQLLVLTLFQRFIVGFEGTSQGLDTTIAVLRYLLSEWALGNSGSPPTDSRVVRAQLALFVSALQSSASSLQVPYQREVDRAVALFFVLLSRGQLRCAERSVSLLSALSRIVGGEEALIALLHVLHPVSAFSYAVETGLLGTLLRAAESPEQTPHTTNLHLRVVLFLAGAFTSAHNPGTRFIDSSARTSTDGTHCFDFSAYEWQGELQQLAAPAVLGRGGAGDYLAPVEGTNKRFLHLNQPVSVLGALCNPAQGGGATLLAWAAQQLKTLLTSINSASSKCRADTATGEESERDVPLVGETIRLCLVLCASYVTDSTFAASTAPLLQSIAQRAVELEITVARSAEDAAALDARRGMLRGLLAVVDADHQSSGTQAKNLTFPWAAVLSAVHNWEVFASQPGPETTVAAGKEEELRDTALTLLVALINRGAVGGASSGDEARLLESAVQFAARLIESGSSHFLVPRCVCLLHTALSSGLSGWASGEEGVVLALLQVLLQPQFAGVLSEDARRRSVSALMQAVSTKAKEDVVRIFSAQAADHLLVAALRAEMCHPDCFERAYCEEVPSPAPGSGDVFPSALPLLLGLQRLGHFEMVGAIVQLGWNDVTPDDNDMTLSDLPLLHALVVRGDDSAAQLETTGTFPYLLRLMAAGLNHPAYLFQLRAKLGASAVASPSEEGADITTVFSQLTSAALAGTIVDCAALLSPPM